MAALGKILKGIGKASVTVDQSVGKVVDKAAFKATDKAIELGDKAKNKMFKAVDVNDKEASMLQRVAGFKMDKGMFIATTGALGTASAINNASQTRNVSKLGEINAGELANTVTFTRSADLEPTLDAINKDPELMEKFQKDYMPVNSHGAEGDIIFALHNLR